MKKIFFLFAAVMSLLVVGCRDVLLEKNTGGFSVSFQTPGSGSRSGTTATWKLEAWLELESGAQLQKKDDTVPANAPITITFDAVPIGTKLKVQVRLEDSENSLIQHEGSSDWITVDAESKTVEVQVQRKIVNAAAPTIITQPQSQNKTYKVGDEVSWKVTFTVEATSEDGGELSYQWYESSSDTTDGGEKLAEATEQRHEETLSLGETKYFYCVVTNTKDAVNGPVTATTTSNVAKIVYNIAQSGVLLWDSASVNIAPYGKWETPSSIQYPSNPPFWCFDNKGNLYVLNADYAGMRYDLKADGTYPSTSADDGNYPNKEYLNAVSYDNVASILYGITDTQIQKLTTSGSEPIIDFSNEGITPEGFAVHNGIAYVADSFSSTTSTGSGEEAVVNFYKYDVENKNLSLRNTITLPEVFASTNNYASVSQMIYQEGALYLLLGCVKDSTPNISSVGAVAKIDDKTLSLDTSFGQGGYLGLVSTERTPSYNDASGSSQKCSVYAASSSTEQVFSRPLGFVAIMPKKLVIADAGCIVYDEITSHGDYPKLKGKAVSRIVTVDLETQSLGFEDLDPYQYYWINNPLGSSVEIDSSF